MRIFMRVPLGGGVKRHWGLLTTAIFGDLGGYVFKNSRDMASSIIWRYATPCRTANECKMNDLEWPWVAISSQNAFLASTSWIRAFECQKYYNLGDSAVAELLVTTGTLTAFPQWYEITLCMWCVLGPEPETEVWVKLISNCIELCYEEMDIE